MSRRTAAADKAIRLAWEKERALVAEGKGTRDWTEEQQKDILDPNKRKAYDDNGRAFEGQHMKSAEKYPEYQGDPGNIQFLTREEHLEAHHGNWQNPTNWYFDPVTKEIVDFGEGKYIPCKVIELSKPIAITVNKTNAEINNTRVNNSQQHETVHNKVPDKPQAPSSLKVKGANAVKLRAVEKQVPKEKADVIKQAIDVFGTVYNTVKKFCKEHPIITGIGTAVATAAVKIGISGVYNGKSSNNDSQSDDNVLSFGYEEKSAIDDDLENTSVNDSLGTSKRSSPYEHEVAESRQRYHTKNGIEWRDKAPYRRGENKDEDTEQK